MTHQEIFNKVASHLLAQGRKSKDPNGSGVCQYRGANGTSCAVGCLIPDEKYDPEMEGCPIGTVLDLVDERRVVADHKPRATKLLEVLESLGMSDKDTLKLLQDLQVIHDRYDTDLWKRYLARSAERWNLDSSILDNFADL